MGPINENKNLLEFFYIKLNGFHTSLKFTVDKFDDGVVHYLDLKIIDNETDIYYKDTQTGQYMHTNWSIHALFQLQTLEYQNSLD